MLRTECLRLVLLELHFACFRPNQIPILRTPDTKIDHAQISHAENARSFVRTPYMYTISVHLSRTTERITLPAVVFCPEVPGAATGGRWMASAQGEVGNMPPDPENASTGF